MKNLNVEIRKAYSLSVEKGSSKQTHYEYSILFEILSMGEIKQYSFLCKRNDGTWIILRFLEDEINNISNPNEDILTGIEKYNIKVILSLMTDFRVCESSIYNKPLLNYHLSLFIRDEIKNTSGKKSIINNIINKYKEYYIYSEIKIYEGKNE